MPCCTPLLARKFDKTVCGTRRTAHELDRIKGMLHAAKAVSEHGCNPTGRPSAATERCDHVDRLRTAATEQLESVESGRASVVSGTDIGSDGKRRWQRNGLI